MKPSFGFIVGVIIGLVMITTADTIVKPIHIYPPEDREEISQWIDDLMSGKIRPQCATETMSYSIPLQNAAESPCHPLVVELRDDGSLAVTFSGAFDRHWKQIYRVSDGRIVEAERIEGRLIPAQLERWEYSDEN